MDLVYGFPPEGTSPIILTTNVDEFTLEEMSHLAAFAPSPRGESPEKEEEGCGSCGVNEIGGPPAAYLRREALC